jgi:hypothetical protein
MSYMCLRQVLDDREEALAILLERAGDPRVLRRLRDGAPQRVASAVIRVRLKRGVPGEVLDIELEHADSTKIVRVRYRCLSISSRDSIEATQWENYTATWHTAQFFAQDMKSQVWPRVGRVPRPTKAAHVVSTPARSKGTQQCRVCGRRRLSREEYNWRRRNGYAVWRCQHRRSNPSQRRELVQAGGVIAGLVACILVL